MRRPLRGSRGRGRGLSATGRSSPSRRPGNGRPCAPRSAYPPPASGTDAAGWRRATCSRCCGRARDSRCAWRTDSRSTARFRRRIDAPTLEATFERPYTIHGALAPSAAFAEWRGGRLRVICHSQGVYPLRESMAEALGLDREAIEIAFAPGSGCYGHNGADDAAFEAALVAMALPDTPILLKWTREEEHAWEPFGPAASVTLAARLEGGRIAEWSGEAFSDTHRGRPRPGPNKAGPARFLASRFRADAMAPYVGEPNLNRHGGLHRNLDPVYAVGARRIVKNLVPGLPLRTSALRTLGAAVNVFAIESFMDELAEAAGADPLAFRLAHLGDARARAALERLGAVLDGLPPADEGAARGIAYAQYKNAQARVAAAAEVAVAEDGAPRAVRLILVADAGRIVDRDGLAAQIEGGAIQALGWALSERVAWDRDGVTTRDWEATRPLRFPDMPEISVELIDRPAERSVGAGEAACGPVIAAVANAIARATGLRPRRLPMDAEALRALALNA
jgi:nicotinate dehydrogenase subunit B